MIKKFQKTQNFGKNHKSYIPVTGTSPGNSALSDILCLLHL